MERVCGAHGMAMGALALEPLAVLTKYFVLEMHGPASSHSDLAELYALRYQIYCLERQFLNAFDYPDGLESDADDSRSAHFAARNVNGEVVGTARLVMSGGGEPFPFEAHCPAFPAFEPPPCEFAAEVSRLAVSKTYRRRKGDTHYGVNEAEIKKRPMTAEPGFREKRVNVPLLVLGLYREMYRYSCENGIRYWYAAMEKPLVRVLAHYGFEFTPIGPEQDYYGPVTTYLGDIGKIERHLEETNPDLLWWFRDGP